MTQKIRIKLKSYDHNLVDKSAEKIVKTVKTTGAVISGPVPLPTHQRIYTVLRSPHVNKKSREQFELNAYKRLIDISVQTLAPNTFIDLHRDDHYKRKMYPYIKGCKKFYWTIENPEGVHFKLGRSGCIPHQDPLLINAIEQPHCVINEGTNTRTSILIYGELSE